MPWKRIQQKFDHGSFTYSGKPRISPRVFDMLTLEEISQIEDDLKNYIDQKRKLQKQAADFVQVYVNDKAKRQRVIITDNKSEDQLQEMRESGNFTEEEVQAFNYHEWSFEFYNKD